ncbi:MAG: hypothetical protein H7X99_08420 [Saprospiraceae bacterium]|nr:hypothetical protein [Saprospiraceae bacterium]
MLREQKDIKGIISLWAFAECGIGGFLHALRLPFTGIFAGGVAIICIVLIGYYTNGDRKKLMEALGLVLMVKLIASPHSPWQAYVAVIFQGVVGWLLFSNLNYFKWKVLFFAVVCMLESAVQKILLSILIYGFSFFKAIDEAAINLMKHLGLGQEASIVGIIFGAYIILHLFTGIFLGLWIPKIPLQLEKVRLMIPGDFLLKTGEIIGRKKRFHPFLWSFLVFSMVILILHFTLPPSFGINMTALFIRVVGISLFLIFVISPIIKFIIKRNLENQDIGKQELKSIISVLPQMESNAMGILTWSNNTFKGWQKLKYFILGILVVSMKLHQDAE